MEKIGFKPTRNLEFGFDRLTVWGGEGHAPITIHTFLHSFFSFQNVAGNPKTGASEKNGRDDPGYRLGTFDFSWRLPYLSHWITLYTDSLVHDDVSPISAPRRSGVHPGVYLARFPGFEHLDLRLEGTSTCLLYTSNRAHDGRSPGYDHAVGCEGRAGMHGSDGYEDAGSFLQSP